MRIIHPHHARSLPPAASAGTVRLLVIIVLAMSAATVSGHGTDAVTAAIMAVLAAAMEQLVRAALRYRARTA